MEEAETPFTFNPSENFDLDENKNKCSIFNRNKKLFFYIVGGFISIIILIIILIIIFSNGNKGNRNKSNIPDNKKNLSNNYLTVKFNIPKDSMETKIFTRFSTQPTNYDYSKNILSLTNENKELNIIDGHYKFPSKGNYIMKLYLF